MKKSELLAAYAVDHSKEQIVRFASSLFGFDSEVVDGGKGSGNFGHKGRPGQRGGSGAGGGSGESSGGSTSSSKATGSSGSSFVSSIIEPAKSNGHAGRPGRMSKQASKKALEKSNHDTANACREKAKQYPVGSAERKAYEGWAKTMSEPLPGRPTPEDSAELKKKNLGDVSERLKPYAKERYKKDLENEPKITNDLCDIADSLGTGMFGLPYRMKGAGDKPVKDKDGNPIMNPDGTVKTSCRIADKIAENQAEARKNGQDDSYEAATDRLSDLVRYTQACTPENLVDNAEATMKALEEKGYKPIKVKNTWESFSHDNPYRGVNCVFESPDGTKFELQFHTAESLVGKEVQHGWYEEARTPGVDPKRKAELEDRMYNNMASMTAPKDIGRIKNYPPKKDNEPSAPPPNPPESKKKDEQGGGLSESVNNVINSSPNIPHTGRKKDVEASQKANERINSETTDAGKRKALFHEMVEAPEYSSVTTGEDTVYIKQPDGTWADFTGGSPGSKPYKGREIMRSVEFADDLPTVIQIPKR